MKLQWTAGNKDVYGATGGCDGVTCCRLGTVGVYCMW